MRSLCSPPPPAHLPGSAWRRSPVCALGRAALGWGLFCGLLGPSGAAAETLSTPPIWSERPRGSAALTALPDLRAVATPLVPVVASIQVTLPPSRQGVAAPDELEPLEAPPDAGLGSGFVISPDGLVLTNYHVIKDAKTIELSVPEPDGSERVVAAEVLGKAPSYDVALLRAKGPLNRAGAFLGDSDTTQIGDWVMAVGSPFGLAHSVSVGIISARERRGVQTIGRSGLYNFLQTDASINPGNSGGPLVNMRGEVIGINTAINAEGAGIGFAIPINMVKTMLPDLLKRGRYARSWLGIRTAAVDPARARAIGLPQAQGVLIAGVIAGGPAARARLVPGDVILRFNGTPLRGPTDLPLQVGMAGPGRSATLDLWRDGAPLQRAVVLGEFPEVGAPLPPK